MKIFTTKMLALVTSALLLGACSQMATYENEDLLSNQEVAARSGFNLTPYGSAGTENFAILSGGGNCITDCIDGTSGDIYAATGSSPRVSWGGPNQENFSKTLSVKVWNTLTTIEYRFTFVSNASGASHLQYYDETTLTWINAGSLVNNVPFAVSRPLPIGWKACDVITEQWREVGGGAPAILGDVSYSLIGSCSGCGESFTYVDNGDDQAYVFTYIPAVNMSGAQLVFTFAQGVAVTGLDTWSTNGSTRQKTVDLVACQVYTWTVDLTPDCSGASANSNVWTDFKVNTVSKKGTLSNITESCN